MKLRELFGQISYCGDMPDVEITDIVYDSRKAKPGCLFVALTGKTVDGHLYIEKAVQAGAAAVVAEHEVSCSVPVLVVENTRQALALLSVAFFGRPADTLKVIGITGTKGKTTTAYMVRTVLETAGHKTGIIGTNGVGIGQEQFPTGNTTPESYEVQKYFRQMLDAGCEYCVIEASSIGLRDHRLDGFSFALGLFTNFSEDHISENEHKDMEEYLHCKGLLFQKCETGIVNADDRSVEGLLEGHTCRVLTYGQKDTADFYAEGYQLLQEPGILGVEFAMHFANDSMRLMIPIPGQFSVYNGLAAAAACLTLGIAPADVQMGLWAVRVKGRVEPVPVPGNYTLIIDYAHNAVSMESILTTLRAYDPNRLIVLFGAGGNRPKLRRYEMGEMAGLLADFSVLTEDNSRFEKREDIIADIVTGMEKTHGKYTIIPDRREAIRYCLENADDGDIIVLAGKGSEDYLDIAGEKHRFDEREVVAELLRERKDTRIEP